MNNSINFLIVLAVTSLCNAQSLDEDRIYATQFLDVIYLDQQLNVDVLNLGNSTVHILETNGTNQVTRELFRLSDSTFLYTEYRPMHIETYLKRKRKYQIAKQGVLVFSKETVVDSTVMANPSTFGFFPRPRERNVFKQTGEWFEKHDGRFNKIKGSYNSKGKHGEWYYFTTEGELDKILTYENGKFINEEYINNLKYGSIEKLRETIEGTWSMYKNALRANFGEYSSTYTFEEDGTLIYTFKRLVDGESTGFTRKGTWSTPNFETVEYTLQNKKKILNLEYLSDEKIRFKE